MSQGDTPCRACREQHKKCDGMRPCARCAKAHRPCEEPMKKKRGRPRLADQVAVVTEAQRQEQQHQQKTIVAAAPAIGSATMSSHEDDEPRSVCIGDYSYESHDPRLVASHKLLLNAPALLYADPVAGAAAFGIELGQHHLVMEMAPFDASNPESFATYFGRCVVQVISPSLVAFFDGRRPATWAELPWEDTSTCSGVCPFVLRDALTTPLPAYGVRQWTHSKRVSLSGGTYRIHCKGYLLSNLRVMFIDCVRNELLTPAALVAPPPFFLWEDKDVFFDYGSAQPGFGDITDDLNNMEMF